VIDPSLRRSKPLSRAPKRKAQVRVGKHTGKIRLSGAALEKLREQVYRRDEGRCQWKGCGVLLPLYGSVFNRAHMAHIKSRGASGSDELANVRILCPEHHLGSQHSKGEIDA
jgi:hypothetical protein